MIRLPEPGWRWRTTGLTTIQSSLALISYCMDVDHTWIREWRDASWYVVFKLGTDQLPIEGDLQLKPQPTINDGDLLLKTFEEGVQVYNPKTRVRSRVVNFNVASVVINFFECVKTLHLLDKSTI
ncbi:unnamed protein product [Lactuca virosa]|uniref:Uncharacterized protein n=1 Tax=Lactuca virosa TaxID=75947 RepID=A0AAU9PIV0_9ASTR|nr:unnamed protein product [Lactuca virosa]